MKLLMVTDTPIIIENNKKKIFEPVLREVENFEHLFSKITWIAYDFTKAEEYFSYRSSGLEKIDVIVLPRTGGKGIKRKIKLLFKFVPYILIIIKNIRRHDFIHSRGPSFPAFLTIILSIIFRKKKFWHKYAGNWGQVNPPFSYNLQIMFLRYAVFNNSTITINGKWSKQEGNILSFANPCLTTVEIDNAEKILRAKKYKDKLKFCFVGRMEDAKGVGKILSALQHIEDSFYIDSLYLIGDGPDKFKYQSQAKNIDNIEITFLGSLSRKKLNDIYAKCHIILLPSSASEGFPKVIAEAMAYGCIPIVSNVGSIPQYISNRNGVVLKNISTAHIIKSINMIISNRHILNTMAINGFDKIKLFSYEVYNQRIIKMLREK
ncbi:MAG: glycosyltransferase family 4 protein [Candidatus Neomarinimicrobiota bacterium]